MNESLYAVALPLTGDHRTPFKSEPVSVPYLLNSRWNAALCSVFPFSALNANILQKTGCTRQKWPALGFLFTLLSKSKQEEMVFLMPWKLSKRIELLQRPRNIIYVVLYCGTNNNYNIRYYDYNPLKTFPRVFLTSGYAEASMRKDIRQHAQTQLV